MNFLGKRETCTTAIKYLTRFLSTIIVFKNTVAKFN